MNRRIFLLFLALAGCLPGGHAKAQHEIEAEYRVGLSRKGYDKVLLFLDWSKEEKKRRDYYLDYLGKTGPALRKRADPIKLRVKFGDDVELQVSRKFGSISSRKSPAILSLQESWDAESWSPSSRVLSQLNDYFAALYGKKSVTPWLCPLVPEFNGLRRTAGPLIRLAAGGEVIGETPIIPLYFNQKLRRRGEVRLKDGVLKLFLGRTKGWDSRAQPTETYELEAEPLESPTLEEMQKLMEQFEDFLREVRLTRFDYSGNTSDPAAFPARVLKKATQCH